MTHVSSSLSDSVAHAVSFLTRPLILSFAPTTITRLQSVLRDNLITFYSPMWDTRDPERYADHRCLALNPNLQPPGPVHHACLATGIQWLDWVTILGGNNLALHVNPGSVSVQETNVATGESRQISIWTSSWNTSSSSGPRKTVAQLILEDDKEADDKLFAILAQEVNEPTWNTPIAANFPAGLRASSPMSIMSSHSRSSSYSSDSAYSLSDSMTSLSSHSSSEHSSESKLSRRERANRVFIDTSKTEVTVYEAANTSVLSGGTMLGGPANSSSRRRA